MSGGYEDDIQYQEAVKEVADNYGVDEKTAVRIIADRNVFALKKFQKWRENHLKAQEQKKETPK